MKRRASVLRTAAVALFTSASILLGGMPTAGQSPPPSLGVVTPAPAGARPDLRSVVDVSRNFVPGARAVPGPASVDYIAINPLVYPYWVVKVDNVVKSGPTLSLTGTADTTPLGAIDTNLPTPTPTTIPTTSPAFVQVFGPDQVDANTTVDGCAASGFVALPDAKLIKAINVCYDNIENAYLRLAKSIASSKRLLTKVGNDYNALVIRAGRLLISRNARCVDIMNVDDPDATNQCGARRSATVDELRHLDDNLAKWVLGNTRDSAADPVTARGVVSDVSKLTPWPSDQVNAVTTAAKSLADLLSKLPAPSPSPSPSAKTKSGRQTTKATGSVTTGIRQDRTCFDGDLNSLTTASCVQKLKDQLAQLSAWAKDSAVEKAYTKSLGDIQTYATQRLSNLSLSRFHFHDREACRGVNGSRRDRTYTLQLDATQITSVTVVCESRIFVSAGVGFSSLSQGQYTTVADTHVPPLPIPAPSPIPSGTGRIQEITTSDVRPIPVALINYRLFDVGQNGEQAFYTSFGAGIASSQQSTFIDYVGGVSYGVTKSALLTLGLHLGQQNVLEPGYAAGDAITGSPPQTSRYRLGWVLVVSYGKQ